MTEAINAVIRVHEWTAWLPKRVDPNAAHLALRSGATSLKLHPGERVMDVEVMNTNMEIQGISETDEEEDAVHTLYVFQATVAGAVKEGEDLDNYITPQPPPDLAREATDQWLKDQQKAAAGARIMGGRMPPGGNLNEGQGRRPR